MKVEYIPFFAFALVLFFVLWACPIMTIDKASDKEEGNLSKIAALALFLYATKLACIDLVEAAQKLL